MREAGHAHRRGRCQCRRASGSLMPARTAGEADPDTDRFRFVALILVEAAEIIVTIVIVQRGHRLLFLVSARRAVQRDQRLTGNG